MILLKMDHPRYASPPYGLYMNQPLLPEERTKRE